MHAPMSFNGLQDQVLQQVHKTSFLSGPLTHLKAAQVWVRKRSKQLPTVSTNKKTGNAAVPALQIALQAAETSTW